MTCAVLRGQPLGTKEGFLTGTGVRFSSSVMVDGQAKIRGPSAWLAASVAFMWHVYEFYCT